MVWSNRRARNLALRPQSLRYVFSHWFTPQLGLASHAVQEVLCITWVSCTQDVDKRLCLLILSLILLQKELFMSWPRGNTTFWNFHPAQRHSVTKVAPIFQYTFTGCHAPKQLRSADKSYGRQIVRTLDKPYGNKLYGLISLGQTVRMTNRTDCLDKGWTNRTEDKSYGLHILVLLLNWRWC